jgi:hypothetical protein
MATNNNTKIDYASADNAKKPMAYPLVRALAGAAYYHNEGLTMQKASDLINGLLRAMGKKAEDRQLKHPDEKASFGQCTFIAMTLKNSGCTNGTALQLIKLFSDGKCEETLKKLAENAKGEPKKEEPKKTEPKKANGKKTAKKANKGGKAKA